MRLPAPGVVKRSILVVGVMLLALAASLVLQVRELTRVTEREPGFVVGTRTALVVLDVQEEYTGGAARAPFPYANAESLVQRINAVADRSGNSGVEVVYLRQVYRSRLAKLVSLVLLGGRGWPGGAGTALDHRLSLASAHVFEKQGADAFSSLEFRSFITQRKIGRLWLAGLDGAGCVDKTARGARAHGLEVTVLDDAVVSLNSAELRALRTDYDRLGIKVTPAASVLGGF